MLLEEYPAENWKGSKVPGVCAAVMNRLAQKSNGPSLPQSKEPTAVCASTVCGPPLVPLEGEAQTLACI